MQRTQLATAVYEGGVLKLTGPVPGLADGDRVEVAVVRTAPPDRDGPSAGTSEEQDDGYDVLEAMNAERLRVGARPLIPPTEGR